MQENYSFNNAIPIQEDRDIYGTQASDVGHASAEAPSQSHNPIITI